MPIDKKKYEKMIETANAMKIGRQVLRESMGFGVPIRDRITGIAQGLKKSREQPAQQIPQTQTTSSPTSQNPMPYSQQKGFNKLEEFRERFKDMKRPRILGGFFNPPEPKEPVLSAGEQEILREREQQLLESAEARKKKELEDKETEETNKAIKRARESMSVEV